MLFFISNLKLVNETLEIPKLFFIIMICTGISINGATIGWRQGSVCILASDKIVWTQVILLVVSWRELSEQGTYLNSWCQPDGSIYSWNWDIRHHLITCVSRVEVSILSDEVHIISSIMTAGTSGIYALVQEFYLYSNWYRNIWTTEMFFIYTAKPGTSHCLLTLRFRHWWSGSLWWTHLFRANSWVSIWCRPHVALDPV